MIPLQDIYIYVKNRKKFIVNIIKRENCLKFEVELLVYNDEGNLHVIAFDKKFDDAKDSFAFVLEELRSGFFQEDKKIDFVDNPCNCEFLSIEEQYDVFSSLGWSDVLIKKNGSHYIK